MQFSWRDAIGKEGERQLASFVERKLGHVYRPTSVTDIGIDGEIEILDESRSSTGGLLKVQVKATDGFKAKGKFKVPIDGEHLEYFMSLTVPTILVFVDNVRARIFWKRIGGKDSYRTKGKGYGVPISIGDDRLTLSSRDHLSSLGDSSNASRAGTLISEAMRMIDEYDQIRSSKGFDTGSADRWARILLDADELFAGARILLAHEERSSRVIAAIHSLHQDLRDRITAEKRWFKSEGFWEELEAWYREQVRSRLDT